MTLWTPQFKPVADSRYIRVYDTVLPKAIYSVYKNYKSICFPQRHQPESIRQSVETLESIQELTLTPMQIKILFWKLKFNLHWRKSQFLIDSGVSTDCLIDSYTCIKASIGFELVVKSDTGRECRRSYIYIHVSK